MAAIAFHRQVLALFACALAPAAWGAPSEFWFPVTAGTSFTFEESGTFDRTTTGFSSFGPDVHTTTVTAIDRTIGSHHATLRAQDNFLSETPTGVFVVGDKGDPALNQAYRIYDDPQPFVTHDPIEVGQTLHWSGAMHGQWVNFFGPGYEAWNGSWDITLTNLGTETVTVPLGTFEAIRFRSVETSLQLTPASRPLARDTGTWTEDRWLVPGVGLVKMSGSGSYLSDFNGDAVPEYRSDETLLYLATTVPEPGPAALLAAGLLLLVLRRARR